MTPEEFARFAVAYHDMKAEFERVKRRFDRYLWLNEELRRSASEREGLLGMGSSQLTIRDDNDQLVWTTVNSEEAERVVELIDDLIDKRIAGLAKELREV